MKFALLGQLAPLTEIQQSVRDHFQRGGSLIAVLLAVFCVLIAVIVVYMITRLLRKRTQAVQRCNPERLFQDLLQKMNVPAPQRRLLCTLASDLGLEHPSTILLSEALFDRCARRWWAGGPRSPRDAELIDQTRNVLFPAPSRTRQTLHPTPEAVAKR